MNTISTRPTQMLFFVCLLVLCSPNTVISLSLTQVRRYLVPDNNDDIRKEQIREMELISDPQAAGGGAAAPEGGAAGAAAGDRPPPSLTPPGE